MRTVIHSGSGCSCPPSEVVPATVTTIWTIVPSLYCVGSDRSRVTKAHHGGSGLLTDRPASDEPIGPRCKCSVCDCAHSGPIISYRPNGYDESQVSSGVSTHYSCQGIGQMDARRPTP